MLVASALEFDETISIGHLLTVATILLSLATLLHTLRRERAARDSDRANAVRAAASGTLAKLERWEELALFFYEEIQPLFIDVSNRLTREDFDKASARDMLWKGLSELHVKTRERIVEEDIELAYVGLQAYDVSAYEAVGTAIERLRAAEGLTFQTFLQGDAQDAVLGLDRAGYEPPVLGNALRNAAWKAADALRRESSEALAGIRSFLLEMVALDDRELLDRRRRRYVLDLLSRA